MVFIVDSNVGQLLTCIFLSIAGLLPSIRQFPLSCNTLAHPCVTTFRTTYTVERVPHLRKHGFGSDERGSYSPLLVIVTMNTSYSVLNCGKFDRVCEEKRELVFFIIAPVLVTTSDDPYVASAVRSMGESR
jgi:hypothetical protein